MTDIDSQNNTYWQAGNIKNYNTERGFGFITKLVDNEDIFFHITNVISVDYINDNKTVFFRIRESNKKPGKSEAYNVITINDVDDFDIDLIAVYNQHTESYIRSAILSHLTIDKLLELFENELFNLSGSNCSYSVSKELIDRFTNNIDDLEIKGRLLKRFTQWSEDSLEESDIVRLYLDDLFLSDKNKIQPLIVNAINAFNRIQQNDLLSQLDEKSKLKALINVVINDNLGKGLDLVLYHLTSESHSGIATGFNEVDKRKKDYWKDKGNLNLYVNLLDFISHNFDDEVLFYLYLDGYPVEIDKGYVNSNFNTLTIDELKKVILSNLYNNNELLNLLKSYIDYQLKAYNTIQLRDNEVFNSIDEIESENKELIYGINEILIAVKNIGIFKELSEYICSNISQPMWFLIWKDGILDKMPEEFLLNYIKQEPNEVLSLLIYQRSINKKKVEALIKKSILSEEVIESRSSYYWLIEILKLYEKKYSSVANVLVNKDHKSCYNLYQWITSDIQSFNYEEYKIRYVLLKPDHQVLFIKKMFSLMHKGEFNVMPDMLEHLLDKQSIDVIKYSESESDEIFSISTALIIKLIKSYSHSNTFFIESGEMTKLLKMGLSSFQHQFKIGSFFETCQGRMTPKIAKSITGEVSIKSIKGISYLAINIYTKSYYGNEVIYNHLFEQMLEEVKALPVRKWNSTEMHWGVPLKFKDKVFEIVRKFKMKADIDGKYYSENPHLVTFEREASPPNGIDYCEGRLAKKKDYRFNREFWWCCNKPCFENCETFHQKEDWKNYTLLDLLTIMGYDLSDENRIGDIEERGKYYQLISAINRYNRMLEHMYCDACDHLLFPVKDSHFAFHRVTRFHCENSKCESYHAEVYLHHCLNGKCNSVIDSRRSQKCPNGLYICTDTECGCCCSHEMLSRRLDNLRQTGAAIHHDLVNAVNNKLGHLERSMHFCYKCRNQMIDEGDEKYSCVNCSIEYDLSKNRINRNYRQGF